MDSGELSRLAEPWKDDQDHCRDERYDHQKSGSPSTPPPPFGHRQHDGPALSEYAGEFHGQRQPLATVNESIQTRHRQKDRKRVRPEQNYREQGPGDGHPTHSWVSSPHLATSAFN